MPDGHRGESTVNVDSILLSEYASAGPDGRLTVANAFNRINGPGPRWGIPMIYVSLVIHGHRAEAGTDHELELRLVNARREPMLDEPAIGSFRFHEDDGSLEEGLPLRHIHTVALMGLVFEEPGPYAFEVYIDGTYHAATALFVKVTG